MSIETLASILNLPVDYLIRSYIPGALPRFYSVLSKGFLTFVECMDIICAEGNRENGTLAAKQLLQMQRDNRIYANAEGYLRIR